MNELRHGGRWRFVQQDADGNQFAFRGVCEGMLRLDEVIAGELSRA